MSAGSYDVRVRAKPAGANGASSESVRVTIPASHEGAGAMLFRRGPTTANKEIPTADSRSASPSRSRPLPWQMGRVSAIGAERHWRFRCPIDEADGSHWLSAQAALAPLAPGDYLIEISARNGDAQRRILTAFRVVP
jgi:hypothetical protein